MNIKNKEAIKNLDGTPIVDKGKTFTIGEALSTVLLASETGGKMKLFILAQKFYNDTSTEIDAADLSMIKQTLENSKVYNALVLGQILVGLEKVEEVKENKDENSNTNTTKNKPK